jgi:threonine/homoserine/homoserine lactone efflux protein
MTSQLALQTEVWRPLMALILSASVVMGSPGPSTISATAMGAAFGVRRSLKYVCGLIAGTAAALLAVAAGVVALVLSMPQAPRLLSAASTIYILYLAFKIATAPPLGTHNEDAAAPAFAGGFLLAVANPKAFFAIAAVFAGATVFADDPRLDAIAKTAVLGVMIVIIHGAWLSAGAALSRVLRDPVRSRLVNIVLAGALVIVTFVAFPA